MGWDTPTLGHTSIGRSFYSGPGKLHSAYLYRWKLGLYNTLDLCLYYLYYIGITTSRLRTLGVTSQSNGYSGCMDICLIVLRFSLCSWILRFVEGVVVVYVLTSSSRSLVAGAAVIRGRCSGGPSVLGTTVTTYTENLHGEVLQ